MCGCCSALGCVLAIVLLCLLGAIAPWLIALLIFLLLAAYGAAHGE